MPRRWMIAIVVGALAAPASALAGGWATVGLSSTPEGLAPGEPWLVEIEVLGHGRSPLEGVQPEVAITEVKSGAKQSVAAEPTDGGGIYRAELSFPRAGTWEYTVDDGFGQTHSYPPVRIGHGADGAATTGPLQPGNGGGTPWVRLALAITAGLLASGLALAAQRRRRPPAGAAAVKA